MPADQNHVRKLFLHAVGKLPPEQWEGYVAEACGGDAELQRQVMHLLKVHQEAGSFLERPAEGLEGTGVFTPAPVEEAVPGERAGALIGPYKLVEEIGTGGMGSVWMAQQTVPVKRLVALKVIKAGMDSKQVLARFEAERQALALMDHPNIAKVLDAGATASGRPYFVMELVRGVPITPYCDEHRLTPRQRLELFLPVCQAIQHAHQKGIIHRDIKPSNVLVALYDGRPVPKVIDFGIAKAAGQQLTEHTLVTGFGTVVGTLEYMSPEQAELNQLDIDTRSDIYSLGVLLYELLTGSTPLEKKRLKQAAMLEVLRLIREEEPPRPSTRLSTTDELPAVAANRGLEPKKLSGLVRGELDWIVMKALEKDRSRRYESANGLALDIQRHLVDEPVQACPPSVWYRFCKTARRNKGKLTAAAVVLVAVLVMAGTVGWAVRDRAARQAQRDSRARNSFYTARLLIVENKLAAAREKLAEAAAQLGSDRSAAGSLAKEIEGAAAALDRLQQFLNLIDQAHQSETTPLIEVTADGPARRPATLPPARSWARRPAAAVPFLCEALALYGVLQRDDWNTTLTEGVLGNEQVEQIRRKSYEELLWLAEDVIDRQQEHQTGRKLSPEAAARRALGYLGKAENAHAPTQALHALRARCRKILRERAAAQADQERADRTPPTMALDHFLAGQAAFDRKDNQAAIKAFEGALRLEPTHYWSLMWLGCCQEDSSVAAAVFTGCIMKRPDHAHAYYCRGNSYHYLGREVEAVADYSRAISLSPAHAIAWNNRGASYRVQGQMAKAVADFSKAIALDPSNAVAWNNRAYTYGKLGQPNKAIDDYSTAIALDPGNALAWDNLAAAHLDLGRFDRAAASADEAIRLSPKRANAWRNRGTAYLGLGRPDKALGDLTRAIELDRKCLDGLTNRGVAYLRLKQPGKALADLSEAVESNPQDKIAWANRGLAHLQLGHLDNAIHDCSRAIALDPNYLAARVNRAQANLRLHQLDSAATDFSQVLKSNENHAGAWMGLGYISFERGDFDKAAAHYSKALKLNPSNRLLWYNRGHAYFMLGKLDRAVDDLSAYIRLAPEHPGVVYGYLMRADANSRQSRFPQALADSRMAVKLAPDDAQACNALAWLLSTCPEAGLRDPSRAVELARKAVRLAPKEGKYWKTLGAAHYRAGDWKAAVAALDSSAKGPRGGDAVSRLFLAMAHHQLGNPDEARRQYEQAIQYLENNKQALKKDKWRAEELRRFRHEAEDLLERKKN